MTFIIVNQHVRGPSGAPMSQLQQGHCSSRSSWYCVCFDNLQASLAVSQFPGLTGSGVHIAELTTQSAFACTVVQLSSSVATSGNAVVQ